MDTRRLKPFAQQCRQRLMQGVAERMHYWGFVPTSRQPTMAPNPAEGGYTFRDAAFDETDVPRRWQMLAGAVQTHGFAHVQETVAYTWFNRLMALKILAHNNYQPDLLAFSRPGTPTPVLLDEARRTQPPYLSQQMYRVLQPLLTDYTRETDAFARLLTAYCTQHQVLHRLFDGADDVTSGIPAALLLPADMLGDTGLLAFINQSPAISDDDYKQVELIGWLYQFYIAERKDEVFANFKKGQKAGPDDIPAATQIFTPRWIVSYLVENTLGRLYLDAHPDSMLGNTMRYLVKSGKVTAEQKKGENADATFSLDSLRLIDPACGSGHILVIAFDLLMRIYDEEGYTKRQAVTAILNNHLVGLDLDERAAQLARFALLLKAGQYYPGVWDTDLTPAVWAMPEPWMSTDSDLLAFLGPDGREYLAELHTALRLMQQSQNLGSVMRLDLSRAGRTHIAERLILYASQPADPTNIFAAITRQHLLHYLHVLLALTNQYAAVTANPPYMGQGNMNAELKAYVNRQYPRSKDDLMTVFMERVEGMLTNGGVYGMINLPSWMFLSSFEQMRQRFLRQFKIESLLHLGRGIFGSDFGSVAFVCRLIDKPRGIGIYRRLFEEHVQVRSIEIIESLFLQKNYGYYEAQQTNFWQIPGEPVAYWASQSAIKLFLKSKLFNEVAQLKSGLATGDNEFFQKYWYEVSFKNIGFGVTETSLTADSDERWYPCHSGGDARKWSFQNELVVDWKHDGKLIRSFKDKSGKLKSRPQNTNSYFKRSISWNKVTSGFFTAKYREPGFIFDDTARSAFPLSDQNTYQYLGLLNSSVAAHFLGIFNPTMSFTNGDVSRVPIIELNDENLVLLVKDFVQSCIHIVRTDWDNRETSWDFAENPLVAIQRQSPGTLRQAYVAWVGQVARQFVQLHSYEESLNRIFIDLYGLQDELTPDVSPRDITLLPEELDKTQLMAIVDSTAVASGAWATSPVEAVVSAIKRDVVARQLISYAVGLLMGRYRLGQSGLHIVHPNPTPEELAEYDHGFAGSPYRSFTPDPDGILPLLGEEGGFPDELGRGLRQVLELIWGSAQLTDTVSWLEESIGQSLDKYLTTGFWADHCRRYQKRPIYWLFSSPKGAFRALVYLHRMNDFTVATLRNKYLLPYIDRLTRQIENLKPEPNKTVSTADLRRSEALVKALAECRQYDLLLRNAADRQFRPDLDAGVVRNYAELSTVLAPIK